MWVDQRLAAACLWALAPWVLAHCANPPEGGGDAAAPDALGPSDARLAADGDASACAAPSATFPCGDASCVVATESCVAVEFLCPPDCEAGSGTRVYDYWCTPNPAPCGSCATCACLLDAGACAYPDTCACTGGPGGATLGSTAY
jgi:hypothetical protein